MHSKMRVTCWKVIEDICVANLNFIYSPTSTFNYIRQQSPQNIINVQHPREQTDIRASLLWLKGVQGNSDQLKKRKKQKIGKAFCFLNRTLKQKKIFGLRKSFHLLFGATLWQHMCHWMVQPLKVSNKLFVYFYCDWNYV